MTLLSWRLPALAATGALLVAAASARAAPTITSRYTPFDLKPPACRSDPGNAEGFTCAGMAGWRAEVGFPAVGASIALVRGGSKDSHELDPADGRSLTIDGLAPAGSPIEWRGGMRGERFEPRAAILRVVVLDPAQRQETILAVWKRLRC